MLGAFLVPKALYVIRPFPEKGRLSHCRIILGAANVHETPRAGSVAFGSPRPVSAASWSVLRARGRAHTGALGRHFGNPCRSRPAEWQRGTAVNFTSQEGRRRTEWQPGTSVNFTVARRPQLALRRKESRTDGFSELHASYRVASATPLSSLDTGRSFYSGTTVTARRFWAQADSFEPSTAGRSLPQLNVCIRLAAMPRDCR